jgi:hypothetical protein
MSEEKPLTPKQAIERARALCKQADRATVVWLVKRWNKLSVTTAYEAGPHGGVVVYWISRDGSERPKDIWAEKMPALKDAADVPLV